MCGICGKATFSGALTQDANELIQSMLQSLIHRGPDGSWVESDDFASFGMARLTIRGLVNGRQPMVDPASGVMVVCNGEIDNHLELRQWLLERGRTVDQDTDVAVLPGLYLELGENYVNHLVGAFAIAIWDPNKKQILLSRDRAGERPLFFRFSNGELLFASQLSAFAKSADEPLALNQEALTRYLQLGHFPAPESPFSGIQKVGPAEQVVIDSNGVRKQHYWQWKRGVQPVSGVTQDDFDPIFRAAVLKQSEVDVPVGLFLSGGIDSSLIAAVARSLHPKKSLTAYGLRFGESSYDEGQFAERVARDLNIEYIPVWVEPEQIPTLLREVITTSGEPLADPAWIPTALLSQRAAQDIRLSLSGEGADELFGGYPTYFGAAIAERYARLPKRIRSIIRNQVESWPPSDKKVTLSFLLKRFVLGDDLDPISRHILWTSSIAPGLLNDLGLETQAVAWSGLSSESLLDQIQRYDLERSLAEGLLTKADRASMHSALELRAPFLDQSVMEFALALTERQRVKGLNTKAFLKSYATRYLPKEIIYRKKRGLSVPLSSWLRGPLKDWAESSLNNAQLEEVGINRMAAEQLLSHHLDKKADNGRALWAIIVMSEWLSWRARRPVPV